MAQLCPRPLPYPSKASCYHSRFLCGLFFSYSHLVSPEFLKHSSHHGLLERGHLLVADDHLVGDLPGVHDEPRLGADEVLVVGELVRLEVLGQHQGDGGRALVDVRLELLGLGQLLRELFPLRRELLLK